MTRIKSVIIHIGYGPAMAFSAFQDEDFRGLEEASVAILSQAMAFGVALSATTGLNTLTGVTGTATSRQIPSK